MADAGGQGSKVVGFDVSFVNTTEKVAKVVLIQIGDTTFAKTGTFSPNVVIAWRIAAIPGPCSVKAVRFDDGSEWAAPQSQNPAAAQPQGPPRHRNGGA